MFYCNDVFSTPNWMLKINESYQIFTQMSSFFQNLATNGNRSNSWISWSVLEISTTNSLFNLYNGSAHQIQQLFMSSQLFCMSDIMRSTTIVLYQYNCKLQEASLKSIWKYCITVCTLVVSAVKPWRYLAKQCYMNNDMNTCVRFVYIFDTFGITTVAHVQ